MSLDPEMAKWEQEWREEPEVTEGRAAGLAVEAARQERRLRVRLWGELAAAAFFLAGSFALAWSRRDKEVALWAAVVWGMTILITSFSVWNWQVLWKGSTRSVAEYTALYRDRARASLRAANVGFAFLAVQLAVAVPWLTVDLMRGSMTWFRYRLAMGLLAVLTTLFIWMFTRMRREALKEIRMVGDIERDC